jgi:hypothetical protein
MIAAPVIDVPVHGRNFMITGQFTAETAGQLVRSLKTQILASAAGSLAVDKFTPCGQVRWRRGLSHASGAPAVVSGVGE